MNRPSSKRNRAETQIPHVSRSSSTCLVCLVSSWAADTSVAEAFFFSSRRRHTRLQGDWSSDVCSSDLVTDANVVLGRLDPQDFLGGAMTLDAEASRRAVEIGRASCGKECRSRWSPY